MRPDRTERNPLARVSLNSKLMKDVALAAPRTIRRGWLIGDLSTNDTLTFRVFEGRPVTIDVTPLVKRRVRQLDADRNVVVLGYDEEFKVYTTSGKFIGDGRPYDS